MSRRHDTQRGFTLVEMLVVIAIDGLIMTAIAGLLVTLFQQSDLRRNVLTSTDQVRFTITKFSNEVRDAQPGIDGSYPVNLASTTQIILFSPYGAQSTTTIQRIRYYLSGGTLYRGVLLPSGNPPGYNPVNEVVTPVVNNVMNTTTPVFSYYSGAYAGTSSPLTQPVNLTQVTFVQMNLAVGQKQTRNATTTSYFIAGASVRSLKTNLGN